MALKKKQDAWGLTMNDLKVIDKIKGFPWKYLRTLGIYKPIYGHSGSESVWGWDYLTVICSRIINEQFGFRRDDLIVWTDRINRKYGSLIKYLFGHLPQDGHYETNGWQEYISESIDRCIHASLISFATVSCLYFGVGIFRSHFYRMFRRWFCILFIVGGIAVGANYHLQKTPWAQDIISGRALESPFLDDDSSMIMYDDSLTTIPIVSDVLVPSRLDSEFLAGMNYIFHHQIGNSRLRDVARFYSGSTDISGVFEKALIESIQKDITNNIGSRFLRQNDRGDWEIMSQTDAQKIIRQSLLEEGNRFMKRILEQVKFGISECKHGRFRRYVMSRKHALRNLEHLDVALSESKADDLSTNKYVVPFTSNIQTVMGRPKKVLSSLPNIISRESSLKLSNSSSRNLTESTFTPASFHLGDPVEAYFEGDGWFPGKVVHLNGDFLSIAFEDGDYKEDMAETFVRPLRALKIGENVTTMEGDIGTIVRLTATGFVELVFPDESFGIFHRHEIRRLQ